MNTARLTLPVPPPGLYPGTPAPVYFAWQAASNTALGKLRRSAAHCRAYLDGVDQDSKAKRTGRPIHAAVLEPDDYETRYLVAERCEARTQKGDRCSNNGSTLHPDHGWACGTHAKDGRGFLPPGVEVVTEAERALHLAVRDSVRAHPLARAILEQGRAEVSTSWVDPETGVACKARLDWYDPERATVADLKSCQDASRREFERAVWRFGYHRQGPFYLGGPQALELPARHFSIVAVEKAPPYAVAVYRLQDDVVREARPHIRALLQDYARCQASGVWPGYADDEVQDLSIPSWAWEVMEDEAWQIQQRGEAAAA